MTVLGGRATVGQSPEESPPSQEDLLMPLAALTDLPLYLYLAIGGGIAAVLAVVLYLLPTSKVKVPAVALGVLAGLAAGLGLGVLLMVGFGYSWESSRPAPPPAAQG